MALIVKDRVLETCSTSGLVDFTLTGAVTGYQRFSAIGNGNTTYYAAYVIGSNDWEVGIGTVGTSSLTRDTILSSSTGSKVNFAGNPVVWCDLPSSKTIFGDANNNISVNSIFEGFTSVGASGTQIVLTPSSTPYYLVTGSGGQTIKLPDATTLPLGAIFDFNNNQSSGAITVNNNSNTLVASIPSGGYTSVILTANSNAAGSWDRHDQAPSNVSWSTNTFDYPGSITSATWNGSTVAVNRGGTGVTTSTGSGSNVLNTSPALTTPAITGGTISNLTQELIGQSIDQGTGVLQVTGQSSFNGAVIDKSLNLQGGNNLLTYSNTFTNAAWAVSTSGAPVQNAVAPDGTTTGWTLTATAGAGFHNINYIGLTGPGTYACSFYLQAGTNNFATLVFNNYASTTNYASVTFNLNSGVVSQTVSSGTFSNVSSSIARIGSTNWYRCVVSATTTSTSSLGVYLQQNNSATPSISANYGLQTWTAAGTETIQILNAQFELGTLASNYSLTTTSAISTTNNLYGPSGQTLFANGTASTPSYSFINQPGIGLYLVSASQVGIAAFGYQYFNFDFTNRAVGVPADGSYRWYSFSGQIGGSLDLALYRDASNILAQRNSTAAQTSRLYNTYTDASNYERHSHVWSSNVLYAKNENAGTGSSRLYIPVTGATTVASLPSAATAGIGGRSFVTDALAPTFGAAVVGGGAVKIPVYSDGTSWYVG
jgi:hypothetical protein